MAIKEMMFSCSHCNTSVYGNYVIVLSAHGSLGFCSTKCIAAFIDDISKEKKPARKEAPLDASPRIKELVAKENARLAGKLRIKKPK